MKWVPHGQDPLPFSVVDYIEQMTHLQNGKQNHTFPFIIELYSKCKAEDLSEQLEIWRRLPTLPKFGLEPAPGAAAAGKADSHQQLILSLTENGHQTYRTGVS